MKRMNKRLLGLLLAVLITIGMLPCAAFAADAGDLHYLNGDYLRFDFDTMKTVKNEPGSDLYFRYMKTLFVVERGASIKDLGAADYNSVKAPSSGYVTSELPIVMGHVYAVKTAVGNTYVLKVTNVVSETEVEFIARKAVQGSAATPGSPSVTEPASTVPEAPVTTGPTPAPKAPVTSDPAPEIATGIEELYWVENGTRFILGGKILFEDTKGIHDPFLSPDKKSVVYSNGSYNLLLYNIAGKTKKSIYELTQSDVQVNYQVFPVGWSPDGSQIAFLTSYRGGFIGNNQLFILNLDDGTVSTVAKGLSSADWGKNGMFVIADGKDVWLVDRTGRNKVKLIVPIAGAFSGSDYVSFTPDSAKVVYTVANKYYSHDIKTNNYEELLIPRKAASNGTVRVAKDGRIAVIEDRKIYIYGSAAKAYSLLYEAADSAYPNWIDPNGAVKPSTIKAPPTNSSVMVDGRKVSFEAYNINGHNYFKLRDVALAVTGSSKQFEVTWDSARNAINMITGKAYTPSGGELTVSSDTSAKDAQPTTSKVYLNNQEVNLTVYNINGSNYFMLRDIGKAINFNVTWDGQNNMILVDTKAGYQE